MKRAAFVLLFAAAGCEPEATSQVPASSAAQVQSWRHGYGTYPQSYPAPSAPWPAPAPQPSRPPPEPPSNPYTTAWNAQRNFDLTLDVPPTVAGASTDAGDPWASYFGSRDAPKAGPLPTTYLVVLLAFDKKGNQGARAAAARKLLATGGAVKRSDMVWEFPSAQANRTPAAVKTELAKVLCDEDHATLLFAEGRALAKLEFAGTTACEPTPAPKAKGTRADPSEVQ